MIPRGIANNNPLNLERGRNPDRWVGLASDQSSDDRFYVFASAAMGIRAGIVTLLKYQDQLGINTVAAIITRWAPSNENDTRAYIDDVATRCGVGETEVINLHDWRVMGALVKAMIWHENGQQPYSDALIFSAMGLGGIEVPPDA